MDKEEDLLDSKSCDIRINNKIVVNSVEPVIIKGRKYMARVDTGATRNSLSREIAKELDLGPAVETVSIRNSHGNSVRDVVEVEVELSGEKKKTKFNISDRSKMTYPVLIGRNLLSQGFLVDCEHEDWDS